MRAALFMTCRYPVAVVPNDRITLGVLHVLIYHFGDQLRESQFRLPAKHPVSLAGVAEQSVHFGRPEVAWIDAHEDLLRARVDADLVDSRAAPSDVHAQVLAGPLHELAHRMLLASCDNEVLRLRLLQHQPLGAHVVARVTPVAQRVQVAQVQALLEPCVNPREAACDLTGYEGLAANRGLMIEQDAAARK